MAQSRCGRTLKLPGRLANFELDMQAVAKSTSSRKTKEEKLWQVEDVLSLDPTGQNAFVKWVGWEGHDSWVSLDNNPELMSYIKSNRANPGSSTLAQTKLACITPSDTESLDENILLIRGAVYDALGGTRYTPDANMGHQKRVSLEIPFNVEAWRRHFQPVLGVEGVDSFDAFVSVRMLTEILGIGWDCRTFPTSTETYVSTRERVRVKWGFKWRPIYNHNKCDRCAWKGPEDLRPSLCHPAEEALPGPPNLTLIFTRKRRNRVAVQIQISERNQLHQQKTEHQQ